MAHQASRRTTREVRQLFGQLYDEVAGLAESFQPCGCGAGANAEDAQDLKTMVQNLLAVRQRAGGCICGPPCDGTSVDNPSDETLQSMLAKLQWDASVLDEQLEPCVCVGQPEIVEETPVPVRVPPTLLTLPPEIRNLIWWMVLEPPRIDRLNPTRWFVRVVQRQFRPELGEHSMDHWFHRPRYSLDRGLGFHMTFRREDERLDGLGRGRWAILRVNRQVYEEAENEFWRRFFAGNMMLSISPEHFLPGLEYYGILAAWTFFNNYRGIYLQQIRRLQLNLAWPWSNDFEGKGVRSQALAPIRQGRREGEGYLIPLLDLMANELPNLQYLSLTFSGWVPDMRVEPWREGPPMPDSDEPPQSSVPWVRRLQNIRGLTRLRLRVIFSPENIGALWSRAVRDSDNEVLRTEHFLSRLRGSMLINGEALGDDHIDNSRRTRLDGPAVIVVDCDDSWDENTREHIHHEEYDRDNRTWDDDM